MPARTPSRGVRKDNLGPSTSIDPVRAVSAPQLTRLRRRPWSGRPPSMPSAAACRDIGVEMFGNAVVSRRSKAEGHVDGREDGVIDSFRGNLVLPDRLQGPTHRWRHEWCGSHGSATPTSATATAKNRSSSMLIVHHP